MGEDFFQGISTQHSAGRHKSLTSVLLLLKPKLCASEDMPVGPFADGLTLLTLDGALSNLTWLTMSLLIAGGLG